MPAGGHDITIRVRYPECDPMGLAHHSVYAVWFETGRTELLRAGGVAYRDLEAAGFFLAVIDIYIKYRRPARYDDLVTLTTRIVAASRVKLVHEYELRRGEESLATGRTTLACLNRDGRAIALPDVILRHVDPVAMR